jgi:DUF1680 family protein
MSSVYGGAGERPGSVHPTATAIAALRPLDHDAVRLAPEGWLGSWQVLNREVTIPHCLDQLQQTGTLDDLRRKAGESDGPRRRLWFSDSDVYKTLEGVGWELDASETLREAFATITALIARAQDDDGYVHSWFGLDGHDRWSDLTNGHEMYCAGHLIQAAVAAARNGNTELLDIAVRFADLLVERFADGDKPTPPTDRHNAQGGSDRAAIDGHPEIEMALVELWRQTGARPYCDLASRMIERRGHGTLGAGHFGSSYYLDHVPVRNAGAVTGHAVRQLYLLCGATDVAVETGDVELLAAVERLWDDAFRTKTYLTGGHGSRHRDEAFGDRYELPADRAYNETCAAIASVMWNWRLLLATGARRYADEMERALYNAVAVGLSADGTHFFYSNPLQLRPGHDGSDEDSPSTRLAWYQCACCPPNLARLGASLHHHVATGAGDTIELHLYAAGRIRVELDAGPVELDVETAYPWEGSVTIRVVRAPTAIWELALRQPGWCDEATVSGATFVDDGDGYLRARLAWTTDDTVTLHLDMPVRAVGAHPAVDAVRGCVALQRGPLVYCFEQRDQPDDVSLDHLSIDVDETIDVATGPDASVTLHGAGRSGAADAGPGELYRPLAKTAPSEGTPVRWSAVAYHRWANRGVTPMRVWMPVATAARRG